MKAYRKLSFHTINADGHVKEGFSVETPSGKESVLVIKA